MKTYKVANNVLGWVSFLIAALVYGLTMEPTASFWDCGEFITTAFKLEVGHPPGAPFFMILGRFFSLFAGGNLEKVPVMMNLISVLASAFTIMFLFWTITHIARKLILSDEANYTVHNVVSVLAAGFIGALAYTFSDTFWFSAVEAEVYATSSLFTALVFWAILKWENDADKRYSLRWIILIAYLIGLSIGVHLLNLLAIPAIVFVYYFKKYKPDTKGVIVALLLSVFLLTVTMYGIIPGIVKVASKFELLFVNSFGMSYHTGVIFYGLATIITIALSLYYSYTSKNKLLNTIFAFALVLLFGIPFMAKNVLLTLLLLGGTFWGVYHLASTNRAVLNTILLGMTVILIGYSSFAMIVIRSAANPPMDQNSPRNVFDLLSYLNREQYGDRPLFYGPYFNSQPTGIEEGSPTYLMADGKYKIIDRKISYTYRSEDQSVFPRMYSSQTGPDHIAGYLQWINGKESDYYEYATDENGQIAYGRDGKPQIDRSRPKGRPSFGANLKFFFRYQINFMYWRYFMWNFVGRQNDIQGHGEITNGNWESGVSFMDEMRLGPQDKLPKKMKNNPGKNHYFFLPFILGLLGAIYLWKRNRNDFWVVMTLFFFTGIAIVIYLNQPPFQPRERDYSFAASFYAYAIYIGIGLLALYDFLRKKTGAVVAVSGATLLSASVPAIMGSENWDDHNRANRYTARDFAWNYLNSCAQNAIIFTNGDNDTFPLWYAQEVENIRTDVRVVNLSYLNTDWYIDQMKRKAYLSDPVPFSLTKEQYIQGKREVVYIIQNPNIKHYDLKKLIEFVGSNDPKTKQMSRSGEQIDYLPTRFFELPVDKEKLLKSGAVSLKDTGLVVDKMQWSLGRSPLRKNDLMVLDLVSNANWERPVYFAMTVGPENYLDLDGYFQLEGLAYRVIPIASGENPMQTGRVNTDIMYDNLMNKFKWGGLESENAHKIYFDENNQRMVMNFRNLFYRLSDKLLEEGRRDSAVQVLDRCTKLIPDEIIPYNYYNLLIAEVYYKAGEFDKGNETMRILLDNTSDNLGYYLSLPEKFAKWVERDMQTEFAVMQEILRVATFYKQDDLKSEVEQTMQTILMESGNAR